MPVRPEKAVCFYAHISSVHSPHRSVRRYDLGIVFQVCEAVSRLHGIACSYLALYFYGLVVSALSTFTVCLSSIPLHSGAHYCNETLCLVRGSLFVILSHSHVWNL